METKQIEKSLTEVKVLLESILDVQTLLLAGKNNLKEMEALKKVDEIKKHHRKRLTK